MYHRNKRSIFLLLLLFVFGKGQCTINGQPAEPVGPEMEQCKRVYLEDGSPSAGRRIFVKPMSDEMTFGEQLLHMAQNMTSLSSAYLFGAKQNTKPDNKPVSKQGIINTLAAVL